MSALIALVTAAVAREVDDDLVPLAKALVERGHRVELVDWDDPVVDWSRFDGALLRSSWDYSTRLAEFLDCIATTAAATRLWNPAPMVRWNTDKRYLDDLAAAGVSVVPSSFHEPGTDLAFPDDGEFVVKPTVSAGSRDTARFGPDQAGLAADLAERIWASGRTVMVQPYQPSVDQHGETALLYFGGAFSHAIRKGPLLERGAAPTRALFAPEHISAVVPTAGQLALGAASMEVLAQRFCDEPDGSPPLYARVDVVATDDDGVAGDSGDRYAVLELELIEPSVFLDTEPGAAARFAAALDARLSSTREASGQRRM
jgi:O-ureido-D-serine cyclo-ligase